MKAVDGTSTSLSGRAYAAIRERILRGQLSLGEPLSRRLLAAELGMSVLPVTEALQRLESDRLVESRPRAGTRVRVPAERDVRESYLVREALEAQAARLFSEHATPVQRKSLAGKAERVDVLFNRLASGDADLEFQYLVHSEHAQFHMFLAECSDCELLYGLIEKNQVLILNWLYDVAARRRVLPPRFHRDLARLLAGGNVLASDQGMREHVRYGLEETLKHMQTQIVAEWRLPKSISKMEVLQTRPMNSRSLSTKKKNYASAL